MSWHPIYADTLARLDADIVCLQEVMFSSFDDDFRPFFSRLGFTGVMQNSSKRSATHQVTCVTQCMHAADV